MEIKELIEILKILYQEHVQKYFQRIILSLALSLVVAGSTSATALLLDPAVKRIFIDKDQTFAWLIPILIIFSFSAKGLSLYFARINIIIKVGNYISAELQKKIANIIIISDIQTFDNRHSGKYISNIIKECKQFFIND